MTLTAKIIGGPGTGKTTELLRLMDKILETDVRDPTQIGFVSFTRAARAEAASRAASRFAVPIHELEGSGWFRTLHSCCYRILGVAKDELVAGSEADAEWLKNATGERVSSSRSGGEDWEDLFGQDTDAGKSLFIWSLASNTLSPVDAVYNRLQRSQPDIPSRGFVHSFIKRYEDAKRKDGRSDFTDLLLRVAGRKMTIDGPVDRFPEGFLPTLPVWFADEWQDCSALQAVVFRRLTESAKWVYLVGDPFQAIYGYAGSDPSIFMDWPHSSDAYRVLDKSYRCPPNVWQVGESIIQRATDYFDRKISPADHDGTIQYTRAELAPQRIRADQNWLVLARTHYLLSPVCAALDRADVPFATTSRNHAVPKWMRGVAALKTLHDGGSIGLNGWRAIVEVVPSKHKGVELLVRGAKTRAKGEDLPHDIRLRDVQSAGGTPALETMLLTDEWKSILPEKERRGVAKIEKHGEAKTLNPSIRVGTIHSAKGMEADNVLLVDAVTPRIEESMRGAGRNEECRVWYVGATRARRRLVVASHERYGRFGVPSSNATSFAGDEVIDPLPVVDMADAPQEMEWTF